LKFSTAWLALALSTASPYTHAELIFESGFEFIPYEWRFVTAWQEERTDGNETQIVARGVNPDFGPQDLNNISQGVQNHPAIAMDALGRFVVTWEDDNDGNGSFQVYARGFNADGGERIPRFTVNSVSAGQQRYPDIAMAPNGDFVIVWQDDQDRDRFHDIMGRGFNANGTEKWSDRLISTGADGRHDDPSVGMAADGSFVVAWSDDSDGNGFYQARARGFTAAGNQRLAEFTVNTQGAGQQVETDVAVAPNGDFVIVWSDDRDNNLLFQIYGRGFSANGTERFPDRTINSFAPGSQYAPAVGMADDGSFCAVWADGGVRIPARCFDADGTARYGDLQTNAQALQYHGKPDITVAPGGQFLVVWEQLTANGNWSIRGRQLFGDGSIHGTFTGRAETGAGRGVPVIATRPSQ
jgi:hypothetical protein